MIAALVERLRAAGCVFAEDEAHLLSEAAPAGAALQALVGRRVAGEPLEQVLGWAAFGALGVPVVPGVLVPRRRTELLAEEALARTPARGLVVELCCGTAAVSLALLAARSDVELHAADVDPLAVGCARANLAGRAAVHAGDLYAALPVGLAGRVNLLVANAPYVPTASLALLPADARDHEAPAALDGGEDGLDVLRRVLAGARSWLAPGGHLVLECGAQQAAPLGALAAAQGLRSLVRQDEERAATVLVAAAA